MLTITVFKGPIYDAYEGNRKKLHIRSDYIRCEWDTGHLEMKMSSWEKLSKKKKNKIFSLAKEK